MLRRKDREKEGEGKAEMMTNMEGIIVRKVHMCIFIAV